MKKPKPFDLSAPISEEGEQQEPETKQEEKQKKFMYVPKHRAGYTKQEKLA